MAEPGTLQAFVDRGAVAAEVFDLRPDYRAVLVAVDGLVPGPSDTETDELLQRAELSATAALQRGPVEEIPQVESWRQAYRAFGAKPQRTRNSLEALLRRAETGLPRVNRLTDIYNAISVLHRIPLGGEDLTFYSGAPRLVRALGTELFETVTGGDTVVEHPSPGEVVWCDDIGVTCRRWNWRQGHRTRLRDTTTSALFILDALSPVTDEALLAAADDLSTRLSRLGPDVGTAIRLVRPDRMSGEAR